MNYEGLKRQIVELIVKEIALKSIDMQKLISEVKLEVSLVAVAMCNGVVDRGAVLVGCTRTAISNKINSYENYLTEEDVAQICEKCGVPYAPRIGGKKGRTGKKLEPGKI